MLNRDSYPLLFLLFIRTDRPEEIGNALLLLLLIRLISMRIVILLLRVPLRTVFLPAFITYALLRQQFICVSYLIVVGEYVFLELESEYQCERDAFSEEEQKEH